MKLAVFSAWEYLLVAMINLQGCREQVEFDTCSRYSTYVSASHTIFILRAASCGAGRVPEHRGLPGM